jgi:poly-beta-1,6-N-acetyl-D-glucosamine synthase
MQAWSWLFFIAVFIVFYNYAGYAVLLWMINRIKKSRIQKNTHHYPSVSFIVAAYNEEDCIEKKMINSLEQDYPAEKIEFIFITDGSTDGTNEIIKKYPSIILLADRERRGKTAALNRVVKFARNEILIFSDANTVLNKEATLRIASHYSDHSVGGVAGEKKVIASGENTNEVGAGEGLYWKYESALKKLDSDFYSVVGAAGELFSLRRELYEPVSETVILDDFIISMQVALKGFRIVYEPGAYAMELPSFSMVDEQKRKIRIAAGGFQAMVMLSSLLKFWKHPKLSFLYLSHRLLRWTLSPICLVLAFISNAVLYFGTENRFFTICFYGQLLFYGMAVLARILPKNLPGFKLFKLAYYFVFMNLSVVQGFFRFLRGRQPAAWEKARRSGVVAKAE